MNGIQNQKRTLSWKSSTLEGIRLPTFENLILPSGDSPQNLWKSEALEAHEWLGLASLGSQRYILPLLTAVTLLIPLLTTFILACSHMINRIPSCQCIAARNRTRRETSQFCGVVVLQPPQVWSIYLSSYGTISLIPLFIRCIGIYELCTDSMYDTYRKAVKLKQCWGALTVWGYRDSPIAWRGREHGFLTSGENDYTILLLNEKKESSDQHAVCYQALGVYDTL